MVSHEVIGEILLKIAENAISDGDFKRAEQFLLKSEHYYDNARVKELLIKLTDGTSPNEQHFVCKSITYKDVAKKFMEKAEDAFSDADIVKAEHFLYKSEHFCPSDRAKELLAKLQIRSTQNNQLQVSKSLSNKDFAEKFIKMAEDAFSDGDLEKAKYFVLKSEHFCPSAHAKEFLSKLQNDNIQKDQCKANTINSKNIVDGYLETAEKAFADGDFQKAELLLKHQNLCQNSRAKEILSEIRNKRYKINTPKRKSEVSDKINEKIQQYSGHTNVPNNQESRVKYDQKYPTLQTNFQKQSQPKIINSNIVHATNGSNSQNKTQNKEKLQNFKGSQNEGTEENIKNKNDYQILGLPENASFDEITRARRRMALFLHPHMSQEPGAVEAYMGIEDAAHRLLKKF